MPRLDTREKIRDMALRSGFKLKRQDDGTVDLHPYVYDFARRMFLLGARGKKEECLSCQG